MGKKSKRKRPTRELKKLLKAKSDELNAMIKKAPEGWDAQKAQRLIGEIRVINERIADVGKSHLQRRLGVEHTVSGAKSRAEELRRKHMANPNLREINQKFLERFMPEAVLCCPKCGEPDHGNRMNGEPWCFKCNSPFSKAELKSSKVLKCKYPENLTFKPLEA